MEAEIIDLNAVLNPNTDSNPRCVTPAQYTVEQNNVHAYKPSSKLMVLDCQVVGCLAK